MSSTDPAQVREQIERTRADLSLKVDTLADSVNPTHVARRQADRVKGAMASARDTVMGTASDVGSNIGSAQSTVADAVTGAPDTLKAKTAGNPLAAGLIAFGVGWLVGSLAPSSTAERKAATTVKDAATPMITDAAKEVTEHLKEPAQEAIEAVKETAAEAAGAVKEQGAAAVQDVRDTSVDSAQTVRQQVQSPS